MDESARIRTARVILDSVDSLDGSEPVEDVAARVRDIEDLVPTLALGPEIDLEVGQELIHANASLLSGWEDPHYVIERMQAIAARVREVISLPASGQ